MDRVRKAFAEIAEAARAFANPDKALEISLARAGSRTFDGLCVVTLEGVTAYTDDYGQRALDLFESRLWTDCLAALIGDGDLLFDPAFDPSAYCGRIPDAAEMLRIIGVRGVLVVEIRIHGERLGHLSVLRWREERPALDEVDVELARHLADVAALKIANARLLRKAKATEDRLFLDAIIENIPDMVFVKDAERLSFVRFNRAGEALLGFPREQLLGKSDFDFFPRSEAEFFVAKDRETLRNKQLVDIPEEPIQTSHGQRWLHTKKVPILDDDGRPMYLLGISEDITDRKRDIAALRAAVERAEAATAELETFSHTVAHDLRTPLRAVDGFARALLEECADNLGADGRRYCERIASAAQRMGELIDDLLELAFVSGTQVRRARIDLTALFQRSLDDLQRLDPQRAVEVVVPGPLEVEADPRLLAIVFDNLCGNAWKFTSVRPAARIELGAKRVGDELVISVTDNGVGFDMAHADRLFAAFQRLHSDSEFPGTGVGLATVHRIITHHGGRVWAEGAVDRGASVYFTLTGA